MNRRLWRYRLRAAGRPGRTERNVHTDRTTGFIFCPDEDIDRYPFALPMRESFCIKPHSAY